MQFDLKPGTAFAAPELANQINADISDSDFLALWQSADKTISGGASEYSVPDQWLQVQPETYTQADDLLGTPPGLCGANGAVRNILALQQCTSCHTVETQTDFMHVRNRLTTASSALSAFLVGPANNSRPLLEDLYYAQNTVLAVDQCYIGYPGNSACTTGYRRPVHQSFHDLARRTLFLAAILNDAVPVKGGSPPHSASFSTQSIE